MGRRGSFAIRDPRGSVCCHLKLDLVEEFYTIRYYNAVAYLVTAFLEGSGAPGKEAYKLPLHLDYLRSSQDHRQSPDHQFKYITDHMSVHRGISLYFTGVINILVFVVS